MAPSSQERLSALRAMPYDEYLVTPEWHATRKRILQRDQYQCQGCHAGDGVLLHVHHYTYERLGCEREDDLVTLCEDCHQELHRLLADPPKLSFLHQWGLVGLGAAALGTIGIEGFLQAPLPAEIGVLLGAYLLAKKSPAIYARLKETLPPEVLGWLGQGPEQRKASNKPSFLDIWLGRSTPRRRRPDASEEEMTTFEAEWHVSQARARAEAADPDASEDQDEDGAGRIADFEGEDDLVTVALSGPQPKRLFSDLLQTGWRPSLARIYVGTDPSSSTHLFVPVSDLWHIALAGATGHGKSSLMRLLMAQLCSLKLSVVLLNPHYMRYDLAHDEDWTPYTPYLKSDPMECRKMATIERMLRWMATDLLEKRKERAARGEHAGKPFFFILDEYPDIKAEIKDAPKLVGKLLRQGRKYNLFLIIASQNYDVKTLGVEGEGGIRKCFRTIFYVGGDPVSVEELLNTKMSEIPENALGRGTIVLKCDATPDPRVVLVPYLDNLSLSLLLGDSTYVKPSSQEAHTDELEAVTLEDAKARTEADMGGVPSAEQYGINGSDPLPEVARRDARRKAEDIDLKVAVALWNSGFNSRAKLAKALDIAENQADKLMVLIDVKQSERRMDG